MSRTLIAAASSIGRRPRRAGARAGGPGRSTSSPETYSTRRPERARRAAACSSRVDLPMPGSPPTSTAEAGTRPPPSTRSSSAMPMAARGGGSALPARPTKATLPRCPTGAPCAAGPGRATTVLPRRVFHSPQDSQRPAHFGVTAPQDWQTKREAGLAKRGLRVVCGRGGVDRRVPRPSPRACFAQYLGQSSGLGSIRHSGAAVSIACPPLSSFTVASRIRQLPPALVARYSRSWMSGIARIVTLDHQPEGNAGLAQVGFQRIDCRLLRGLVGGD